MTFGIMCSHNSNGVFISTVLLYILHVLSVFYNLCAHIKINYLPATVS